MATKKETPKKELKLNEKVDILWAAHMADSGKKEAKKDK